MQATFKVEDAVNIVSRASNPLQGVLHKNEMNGHDVFKVDSEDPINPSKHAVPIVFDEVLIVIFEHMHKGLKFSLSHSLDDELVIMAEEEEAPTLAL